MADKDSKAADIFGKLQALFSSCWNTSFSEIRCCKICFQMLFIQYHHVFIYIYMILYVFVVVAVKIKAKSKRIVLSVGNGVNWQDFLDEVFLFFVLIFRKTAKP